MFISAKYSTYYLHLLQLLIKIRSLLRLHVWLHIWRVSNFQCSRVELFHKSKPTYHPLYYMHFDVVVYYDTLEKKKRKIKIKNPKKKVVLSYVISCMHDACEREENGRVRNFIHSDVLIIIFFRFLNFLSKELLPNINATF